ncbi:MAG: alpha/beta hydrolase [Myxococcaceae bacterium]|nr:alpha/beta hydrolase [Myxococcaceae bacterium]MCI0673731.1 alpha/beta hydrolase [Myxococcaceae bacterium]
MHSSTSTVSVQDGHSVHLQRWAPATGTPVRGVMHLVHGMAEHAARYARLAGALTARGWVVYAHDQRGHGRTAAREEDLGFFAPRDGWNHLVRDLGELLARERSEHPGVPLVLLGHSMGSFVVQQFLSVQPELVDAAVLSASNGSPPLLAHAGRLVARLERARLGPRGRSKLLGALSFGEYNKAFAPTRTAFDWLSRDAAEVDLYVADPRCGFDCTTTAWVDLLDALPGLTGAGALARIPKDLPVYVFSGDRDPVGENGKGVRRLVEAYQRAGLRSVTLTLYPEGRHEMLNETNRDQVVSELLAWLEANARVRQRNTEAAA